MSFNLLYVPSLHPIQEQDDCLTWSKLGINFFSTGYLRKNSKIGDMPIVRGRLHNLTMKGCEGSIFEADKKGTPLHSKNKTFSKQEKAYNIWKFTEEFLSCFDAVIFCHFPHSAILNWDTLKKQNKIIIIKTFGMQFPDWEDMFYELRKSGAYIVRNSPHEQKYVKRYCGHDAIIRGSSVVEWIHKWKGGRRECVTFASNFGLQSGSRRKLLYEDIRSKVKYKMFLYGAANEDVEYNNGFLSHKEKIEKLTRCNVNLVTGTPNSNNTFSAVEALCVGQPCVIFNRNMWGGNTSELDNLLVNGEHAILANSTDHAADSINRLAKDKKFGRKLSANARKYALSIWGRSTICKQWQEFFRKVGLET